MTESHSTRRGQGGARSGASSRVSIRRHGPDGPQGAELEGWSLNLSRGGVRVVVEEVLEVGEEVTLALLGNSDEDISHHSRVVWVQEEADGQIVGLQFIDAPGTVPPPGVP